MGTETFAKRGAKGHCAGYKKWPKGNQREVHETEFYEAQNQFGREEFTRVEIYAKEGTDAARAQNDPYGVTFPISRYRSIRP